MKTENKHEIRKARALDHFFEMVIGAGLFCLGVSLLRLLLSIVGIWPWN